MSGSKALVKLDLTRTPALWASVSGLRPHIIFLDTLRLRSKTLALGRKLLSRSKALVKVESSCQGRMDADSSPSGLRLRRNADLVKNELDTDNFSQREKINHAKTNILAYRDARNRKCKRFDT